MNVTVCNSGSEVKLLAACCELLSGVEVKRVCKQAAHLPRLKCRLPNLFHANRGASHMYMYVSEGPV
jgi:hypothetical protein